MMNDIIKQALGIYPVEWKGGWFLKEPSHADSRCWYFINSATMNVRYPVEEFAAHALMEKVWLNKLAEKCKDVLVEYPGPDTNWTVSVWLTDDVYDPSVRCADTRIEAIAQAIVEVLGDNA